MRHTNPIVVQFNVNYFDFVKGNFSGSSGLRRLHFCQPIIVGSRKVVSPPVRAALDCAKEWQFCLVGYFIKKRLPTVVSSLAKKLWASKGLCDVLANDQGFYFFKFSDEKSCLSVLEDGLEDGPWHIYEKTLILKRWKSGMVLSKASHSSVPIWVKPFNVPFEYWNAEGFSHVASVIGRQVHVDSLTESRKKVYYARVCMEIDASDDLVESFDLVSHLDVNAGVTQTFEIKVKYQWRPQMCMKCRIFGHSEPSCPSLKPWNVHLVLIPTSEAPAPMVGEEPIRKSIPP
ncbi:hypothetical protein CerSpe_270250 [Prunus speciosa]